MPGPINGISSSPLALSQIAAHTRPLHPLRLMLLHQFIKPSFKLGIHKNRVSIRARALALQRLEIRCVRVVNVGHLVDGQETQPSWSRGPVNHMVISRCARDAGFGHHVWDVLVAVPGVESVAGERVGFYHVGVYPHHSWDGGFGGHGSGGFH